MTGVGVTPSSRWMIVSKVLAAAPSSAVRCAGALVHGDASSNSSRIRAAGSKPRRDNYWSHISLRRDLR
jgi:hypothetical protein